MVKILGFGLRRYFKKNLSIGIFGLSVYVDVDGYNQNAPILGIIFRLMDVSVCLCILPGRYFTKIDYKGIDMLIALFLLARQIMGLFGL